MINKVILIGNITNDLDLRQTKNDEMYVRFSIAVKRDFKTNGEYKADFFNCVAWKGQAQFLSKYCSKGTQIAITGRLTQEQYTDSEGKRVNNISITVQEVNPLGNKKKEENPQQEKMDVDGFNEIDDDDFPF